MMGASMTHAFFFMPHHFSYDPAVLHAHPTLATQTLLISGVSSISNSEDLTPSFLAMALERLALTTEGEMEAIKAWRRAFFTMGYKPTQYRCASESLLRRLRKEGNLPSLHPLVDVCNAISVAFAIPIAAFDADKISGALTVRKADGMEIYTPFSGAVESPDAGEIIFSDDANCAHARRWTHRQSGYSAVGVDTSNVLIVAEALHSGAHADLDQLTTALVQSVHRMWPQAVVQKGKA